MAAFLVGGAGSARAQSSQGPASLYCQPGLFFIGGFCVKDVGFVPQPEECPHGFGPVSFGPAAGCGGASSAAFSALRVSSLTREMSSEGTDMVNDRLRRRIDRERVCRERPEDPQCRLEQFASLGGIATDYAADVPGRRNLAPLAPMETVIGPRPAIWAQAFGDYERNDQNSTVAVNQRVQTLDLTIRTRTGGVVGGADILFNNVALASDVLVLGVTGGYLEATTKFSGARYEQRINSASVGAYGAYVLGPLAFGLAAKVDFLDLHANFSDFLASPPFTPVFGGFETDGQNTSVGGTVSYRFDLGGPGWYAEPTIGVDYISSRFDNASELGLANGSTLRVRGGSTFGTFYRLSDSIVLQPSIGTFIFSNVDVQNGTRLTVDFNGIQSINTDEGKVRGEVQGTLAAFFSNGFSAFARAEVRFGEDLFGAGGRVGIRYQF
jgi:outer membrane autotransporter protein